MRAVPCGASPHTLDGASALWLEEQIRQRFSTGQGSYPHDEALEARGRACRQLADVIAEDLATGSSPEPIKPGDTHIRALNGLLRDTAPDGNPALTALAHAISRYITA
jgi:hypothetical protein